MFVALAQQKGAKMKLTKKQKKQQKEVAEKLKKHWNDTDIPWNLKGKEKK